MSFTTDIAGSSPGSFGAGAAEAAGPEGAAIQTILDMLINPDQANSSQESLDMYLMSLHNLLRDFTHGTLWIMGQVYGAWKWTQDAAQDIGRDFETIQGANQSAIRHIVDTMLPHSLAYLRGEIFSTAIVPLREAVEKLDHRVSFLEGWRGQIDTWRRDTVDPTLEVWRQFHSWFDKNAAPVITTVDGWLDKPGTFGTWAAPYVAAPLVGYVADPDNSVVRDALTLVMVRAWSERPNLVWEAVLQWAVTDTR